MGLEGFILLTIPGPLSQENQGKKRNKADASKSSSLVFENTFVYLSLYTWTCVCLLMCVGHTCAGTSKGWELELNIDVSALVGLRTKYSPSAKKSREYS